MEQNEKLLASIWDNAKSRCLLMPASYLKENFFSKIKKALFICTTNDHHVKLTCHGLENYAGNLADKFDLLVNENKTVPDKKSFANIMTFKEKFEPIGKDSNLVKKIISHNYDVIFFTCNKILNQTYLLTIDKTIPNYENISELIELMPNTGFTGIDSNYMIWWIRDRDYCFVRRNCIPEINFDDLDIQQTPDEIKKLYSLAYELEEKSIVVEVGAFKGGSTVALGSALKSKTSGASKVYSIDPCFQPDFYKNITRYNLDDIVVPLQMESIQAALSWPEKFNTNSKNIDFILIDGCHWFDMVKNDIYLWERYIKPGGIIAIHDYAYRLDFKLDVVKAAYELILMRKEYEFIELVDTLLIAKKL